jgi:uncharacterized Zn-binding protein involved in type VI secretion
MSLGIARCFTDTAGGTILGQGNSTVYVNGLPASVLGDAVAGHGNNVHAGPTMVVASGSVFCSGIGVCRQSDSASCGHSATGSSNVFAGG